MRTKIEIQNASEMTIDRWIHEDLGYALEYSGDIKIAVILFEHMARFHHCQITAFRLDAQRSIFYSCFVSKGGLQSIEYEGETAALAIARAFFDYRQTIEALSDERGAPIEKLSQPFLLR